MLEKRKHKRVYFSLDEDIFVEIKAKSTFKARLLSLSEGGISFFLPLKASPSFKRDDLIFLSSLRSSDEVLIDSLVSLSVRHVIEEKNLGKVIVGCKFLDLSEKDRERIREFVKKKIEEMPL